MRCLRWLRILRHRWLLLYRRPAQGTDQIQRISGSPFLHNFACTRPIRSYERHTKVKRLYAAATGKPEQQRLHFEVAYWSALVIIGETTATVSLLCNSLTFLRQCGQALTDQVLDRKRKFLTKLVDCVCENAVCVAVAVCGFARAELDSMYWLCYNKNFN